MAALRLKLLVYNDQCLLRFTVHPKAVTKQEEIEYNLSNRVRDAELSRKQREQSCKRLMNKLLEMRRTNAAKLKKEMVEMSQQEKALEQRVLREQSYLFKSHVSREEGYLSLQQHRMKMQEDRSLLNEVSREHQRLMRIGEKTDMITSFP
ncbi:putative RNA-binding protein 25 [Apostichopus japonicus]|uniref:Putative RNA-binding protein 25 n=1 Tax=Stichopus japonicus TaxID=307972 RepID=A0A2G8JPW4_STIJA|nr:putative RNA-binding protein 25 [Apostichopus japonicus]